MSFEDILEAAEQGHDAEAQFSLGAMYEEGLGVNQDFARAAYWYLKAADQGHASAQNNIGSLYYNGTGVFRNKKKAKHWHTLAAAQGHQAAQRNLSKLDYPYSGDKEITFGKIMKYILISIVALSLIGWGIDIITGLIKR